MSVFLGIYVCAECSHPLFSSRSKYHHETPWPAFTKPIQEDSLKKVAEEGREEALKVGSFIVFAFSI